MAYKKTSAYLNDVPKELSFVLRFSDNSGDRLRVHYLKDTADIKVGAIDDDILIAKEDVKWLIKRLEDIQGIIEFENDAREEESQNPPANQ